MICSVWSKIEATNFSSLSYGCQWSTCLIITLEMRHELIWWRHQMETFSALLALCAGSPVNSPHKGQWRGALMFSLICAWIIDWINNREAGDLRRHRVHYDVIIMIYWARCRTDEDETYVFRCLRKSVGKCLKCPWSRELFEFIKCDILRIHVKTGNSFTNEYRLRNENSTKTCLCHNVHTVPC